MKLNVCLAVTSIFATLGFTVLAAAPVPAYVSAAIADKNRPPEDASRDAARKPADMLVFAGIKPGDKVVDLIPGKGYFTRIFAKAVGSKGHVYAYFPSEIDSMLKGKEPSVTAVTKDTANYPNVSLIHAPVMKFSTPEPVDVVWTSQNYHDMHDSFFGPADLSVVNKAIYNALKPGGTYVVLDHVAEPGSGLRAQECIRPAQSQCVRCIDPREDGSVHLQVPEATPLIAAIVGKSINADWSPAVRPIRRARRGHPSSPPAAR